MNLSYFKPNTISLLSYNYIGKETALSDPNCVKGQSMQMQVRVAIQEREDKSSNPNVNQLYGDGVAVLF